MAGSVVRVVISSVTPSLEAKKKTQWALMVLDGASVTYEVVDVCDPSKRDSKEMQMWKENSGLKPGRYPQFFSDGAYLGNVEDFENAVENYAIRDFLKLPELDHTNVGHDTESSDVIGVMTEPFSTPGSFLMSSTNETSNSDVEEGSAKGLNEKLEDEEETAEEEKASLEESAGEQEEEEEKENAEDGGLEEQKNVHDEGKEEEEEGVEEHESAEGEEEVEEVEAEEDVEDLSDLEAAESAAEDSGDGEPASMPENADPESENSLPHKGSAIVGDARSDSLDDASDSLNNSISAVHD